MIVLLVLIPIFAMGVTAIVAVTLQKAMVRIEDTCTERFKILYDKNKATLALDPDDKNPPPAWIAAQTQLEAYIGYNKFQSKVAFWAALFVMLTGFWLTCFGIVIALTRGASGPWSQSALSVVSGVITQLIGGTFILVYRTIAQQTSGIITMLDRTNLIGMTTCLIRGIPDQKATLRAETFAKVAAIVAACAGTSPGASHDVATDGRGFPSDGPRPLSGDSPSADAKKEVS